MTDSDVSRSDSPDELIELGRTAGAYGFKGWVRIQPEGTGEVLQKVRDWVLVDRLGVKTPVHVKGLRVHGTGLIAKWDGCESKEAADAVRVKVGVLRKDFPAAGKDAVWAIDFVRHFARRTIDAVERHVADTETEAHLKRLREIIRKAGSAGVTKSELTRASQWLRARDRDDILLTLVESGDIVTVEQETGGRKAMRFRALR